MVLKPESFILEMKEKIGSVRNQEYLLKSLYSIAENRSW
jgi:hypothetical protein